jgi:hypothetical protein
MNLSKACAASIFAALVGIGCSGDAEDDEPTTDGSCVLEDGTYTLRYTRLSGDCPAVADEVLVVQNGEAVTAANASGVECETTSSDCSNGNLAATETCKGSVSGERFERHAVLSWDVFEGTGTYQVRLIALTTGAACNGTYSFVVVQQ